MPATLVIQAGQYGSTAETFVMKAARPYVFEHAWEALIVKLELIVDLIRHLDFMRLDPKGRFYLRRAFEDDIQDTPRQNRRHVLISSCP